MNWRQSAPSFRFLRPILAIVLGLLVGGIFVLFTNVNPIQAYRALLTAGFGCQGAGSCAILTALQYATPLLLSGLSAAMALHTGVFSIGQAGQMVLGAAMASWIGSRFPMPPILHAIAALVGAALGGAVWGLIPGLLKEFLKINEVISSFILNRVALMFVAVFPLGHVAASARLLSIARGTKLNTGFFVALIVLVLVFFYLWRSIPGYELRMVGQAPLFARYGGLHSIRALVTGMAISGALAGLAGGIEVLGVYYRFVGSFSTQDNFDGVIVALMGQLHPLGILLASIFLGGIRLGAMNGLSLIAGIPRELGEVMIAFMIILMCADTLYQIQLLRPSNWIRGLFSRLKSRAI